jgi:hypothetical protein
MDEKRMFDTDKPRYVLVKQSKIGWIFVGSGALCMVLAILWMINTLWFLPGTISTTGTIISCTGAAYEISCQSTIRFKTQAGQLITFTDGTSPNSTEGSAVTVVYHPDHPQDARIDPRDLWLTLIIAFGLDLFFIGIGIHLLRSS